VVAARFVSLLSGLPERVVLDRLSIAVQARHDPSLQVPGEEAAVLALQVRPSPIAAIDHPTAGSSAAAAFHLPVIVVKKRIVGRQLLANGIGCSCLV